MKEREKNRKRRRLMIKLSKKDLVSFAKKDRGDSPRGVTNLELVQPFRCSNETSVEEGGQRSLGGGERGLKQGRNI